MGSTATLFRRVTAILVLLACTIAATAAAAQSQDGIFSAGFDRAIGPINDGPCADVYRSGFQLREGRFVDTAPAPAREGDLPRPDKGEAITEPTYETCLVRTTDHRIESPQANFLRNDYSRRQAFNADQTRLFVNASNGYWHLYDARTLQYLSRLIGLAGDAEPQWHPTDPNLLYYVPIYGGTRLLQLDIRTMATTTVADFDGKLPSWASTAAHVWTRSEGSPSADARYWGFQIEDGGFSMVGYMVWDLVENRLVGSRRTALRPDHVSMTPSGRWFVSSGWEGTWAWSPDFSRKKKLHNITEHSDIATGATGNDVYVAIDYQTNGGDVFFTDIDACPAVDADALDAPLCPRTALFATYGNGTTTALHISGKAYGKPGWVVISPYGTQPTHAGDYPWYANKVFAMELAAEPRVFIIAEHRSIWDPSTTSYWFEPHATVSRDFTRVFYNSSWNSHDERDIEAYLIELPSNAIGGGSAPPVTPQPPVAPPVTPPPTEPPPPVTPPVEPLPPVTPPIEPQPPVTPPVTPPPASGDGPCANFYPVGFNLVEGRDTLPEPTFARPTKGIVFADPTYGTCVTRASDHAVEFPSAALMRNDYSRRQAYNADHSRYILFSSNGWWHLYDADTMGYISRLSGPAGDSEPHWHPTNPNLLYYVPNYGGTKLFVLDIGTGVSSVVVDFAGRLPSWASSAAHIWTKSEGAPSADARYWGFQVENGNYNILGFIVWDIVENRLVGSRQASVRPDHVSMSPSGRWFISSGFEGTWAWSPDFSQKKKLHGTTEHSDIAIGKNGNDTYVAIDYQSANGDVFFTDIDACPAVAASATSAPTCPRTALFSTYNGGSTTALHVSGKGYGKPGWVVVSTYGTQRTSSGQMPWYGDKVFAIELSVTARTFPLVHHHSVWDPATTSYWFEPHASVSRDFTRILYNSSWNSHDERDIDAWQVQVPATALP